MKVLSGIVALLASAATNAFAPVATPMNVQRSTSLQMAETADYIDMDRRVLMNLILVGSAAVTVGGLAVPFIAFFIPPGSGGGGGAITAKDAIGNDIVFADYLKTHPANDRSLAQGLSGDAT